MTLHEEWRSQVVDRLDALVMSTKLTIPVMQTSVEMRKRYCSEFASSIYEYFEQMISQGILETQRR